MIKYIIFDLVTHYIALLFVSQCNHSHFYLLNIYSLPLQTTVSLHKPQQPKSSSQSTTRTTTHHSLPRASTALSSQQTMEKKSDATLYSACLPRIKTLAAMQKSVITSEMGTQGLSLTWHQRRASYQQINLLRLARLLSSR